MQIILDISANTHKNDIKYLKGMIDSIPKSETHEIIIKHQLFESAGENIPLRPDVFEWAYKYAKKKGFKTTASVFAEESLKILLQYDIPFVKIANRRDLYPLSLRVPSDIPVVFSFDNPAYLPPTMNHDKKMLCISKYPSTIKDYESAAIVLSKGIDGISDHTKDMNLFKRYGERATIWEFHYALPNSSGLDFECGICRTPQMLREIL